MSIFNAHFPESKMPRGAFCAFGSLKVFNENRLLNSKMFLATQKHGFNEANKYSLFSPQP
jgi:hypothetical protein